MSPAPRLLRESIFVDTSAFFALADRTDRFHSLAIRFVESNQTLLVTSNLVVQETITLIRMRLGHEPAVKFGRRLLSESVTPIIRVKADDEQEAWRTFRRYVTNGLVSWTVPALLSCDGSAFPQRSPSITIFGSSADGSFPRNSTSGISLISRIWELTSMSPEARGGQRVGPWRNRMDYSLVCGATTAFRSVAVIVGGAAWDPGGAEGPAGESAWLQRRNVLSTSGWLGDRTPRLFDDRPRQASAS